MFKKNKSNIDLKVKPNHIAIIMDGNGRWAKKRKLPRIAGHKKGADAIQNTIEFCINNKIGFLTLYAFSSENWNRSDEEVQGLMELLRNFLDSELVKLNKNDICLKVIGDKSKLADDIVQKISEAENLTVTNNSLKLNIALSYGSRQEIVNSCKSLIEYYQISDKAFEDLDEDFFAQFLYTNNLPDPDLLIRTGGEKRLSNFLLWQSAYAELFFTDVLWPNFSDKDLEEALIEFSKRERRYGNA